MIKRRRVLIDRTFQLRLATELMLIVLIVPLVIWADFYLLAQYAKTVNVGQSGPSGGLLMMGSLIKTQWWLMILLYLINFALVYFLIVYYSHRIAGPVYRFSIVLNGMTKGKLSERVKLRKNDYFENLGDSINNLSKSFSKTIEDLKETTEKLAGKGDAEIKELASSMSEILDRYEVRAEAGTEAEAEAETEKEPEPEPDKSDKSSE